MTRSRVVLPKPFAARSLSFRHPQEIRLVGEPGTALEQPVGGEGQCGACGQKC